MTTIKDGSSVSTRLNDRKKLLLAQLRGKVGYRDPKSTDEVLVKWLKGAAWNVENAFYGWASCRFDEDTCWHTGSKRCEKDCGHFTNETTPCCGRFLCRNCFWRMVVNNYASVFTCVFCSKETPEKSSKRAKSWYPYRSFKNERKFTSKITPIIDALFAVANEDVIDGEDYDPNWDVPTNPNQSDCEHLESLYHFMHSKIEAERLKVQSALFQYQACLEKMGKLKYRYNMLKHAIDDKKTEEKTNATTEVKQTVKRANEDDKENSPTISSSVAIDTEKQIKDARIDAKTESSVIPSVVSPLCDPISCVITSVVSPPLMTTPETTTLPVDDASPSPASAPSNFTSSSSA